MAAVHQKQKRMLPLIRIRQTQFDQALSELQSIQNEVHKAAEILRHYQTMYIQGVDRLNQERQSPERKMLEALESSIDLAKQKWYQKLSILRELQEQERLQLQEVQTAQLKLKMMEKIEARYTRVAIEVDKKFEQKMLDEIAFKGNHPWLYICWGQSFCISW